jgi:pyruvate dehydrogenase E2 component (dihydrolipoamide acetyltransferase)
MATEVLLPKQGLQMVEGTIVRWLKKKGDKVVEGEPLLEIETDKTILEVLALASGTLLEILREEGETVPVAETIAVIGDPAENPSRVGKTHDPRTENADPPAGGRGHISTPRARMRADEGKIDLAGIAGSGPEGLIIERDVLAYAAHAERRPKATHLAERIARQQGVDISRISHSTGGDKLRKEDVLRLAVEARAAPPLSSISPGGLTAMSAMRRTIARRMKESLAVSAQAFLENDVDCTEMILLREGLKKGGAPVTFTDIVIKIVAMSLQKHPGINSTWTDEGIRVGNGVHIGMAVALAEGIIVPVIHDADILPLKSIGEKTRELIAQANDGKLQRDDLEGSGFTVTNLGMYGVDRFTAIINQPESGILAVGKITEKPVVIDHAIQVRPQMTLTLTYDHRVIDGAPAAKFMGTVKEYLENPYILM